MIDMKLVRENPELIRENYKLRNNPEILEQLNEVINLDEKWRKLKYEADRLRHERNDISEKINEQKKLKKDVKELVSKAKKIIQKLEETQNNEKKLEEEIRKIMLTLPNLLDKRVPFGKDALENKEIKRWGEIPDIKNPLSHVELGKKLDILDLDAATKLTGAGFYVFKNDLARLVRALMNFFLDYHTEKGRTEVWSPILANEDTATGTAHLPKFDLDMYKTREGFYLVPTAEMTLTNLHKKETLEEEDLPKRYCAYTPCFRTEAGRHGSETPGIFRVHQFDKVEMVTLCKPEDNNKELQSMLDSAEELLRKLEIPYRIIILCSGDNGFKESITYDIETWSPFMKRYMETSSVSSVTDFQARRMNTKYNEKKSGKAEFVYTLNGSGLAFPRLLIALMENNQQKDGSIKIPKALQAYMGGKKVIQKKE